MDRQYFYASMNGTGELDYEIYLNTKALLHAQKDFHELCNADELQFQIVHQVEELWMKSIAFTLLDIDDYIQQQHSNKVITLFQRVQQTIKLMTEQLSLLETMSPKDYQAIRLQLGNGSGQESPGFRTLLQMPAFLWQSFCTHYLQADNLTVEKIYHEQYNHDDAYMIAECLIEFDERFQTFRYHHLQLIHRTIGLDAQSLKGRSVELLDDGVNSRFFPELWQIRHQMTDAWSHEYGTRRENIQQ